MIKSYTSNSPDETFRSGEAIGRSLNGGDVVLLFGELGAGKTLLTKGILNALDFDIDEVTSPSFTLVNLYKTARFDVYHIDLWRLDATQDVSAAIGLDEILENERAITVIEWAEHLGDFTFPRSVVSVELTGDGDEPRKISISRNATDRITSAGNR